MYTEDQLDDLAEKHMELFPNLPDGIAVKHFENWLDSLPEPDEMENEDFNDDTL